MYNNENLINPRIGKKVKHYTKREVEFLKNCMAMKKYRTKCGLIRVRKVRSAFEKNFGYTRSLASMTSKIHSLRGQVGLVVNKNQATQRIVKGKPFGARQISDMTLGEIQTVLAGIMASIEHIKQFVK